MYTSRLIAMQENYVVYKSCTIKLALENAFSIKKKKKEKELSFYTVVCILTRLIAITTILLYHCYRYVVVVKYSNKEKEI